MSTQFAGRAIIAIDYSGGRKVLRTPSNLEVGTTKEKKPIAGMTSEAVDLGYTTSNKKVTWSIEVPIPKGEPEVDWEKVRDDDEEFMLTWKRDRGGKKRQLVDCVVNEVTETANTEGEAVWKVSGLALDNRAVD